LVTKVEPLFFLLGILKAWFAKVNWETALKSQITILKLQTISKLQILMTKTFQSLIGCLAVILSVLNFEFRSLIFVWYLYFGAWDFHISQ